MLVTTGRGTAARVLFCLCANAVARGANAAPAPALTEPDLWEASFGDVRDVWVDRCVHTMSVGSSQELPVSAVVGSCQRAGGGAWHPGVTPNPRCQGLAVSLREAYKRSELRGWCANDFWPVHLQAQCTSGRCRDVLLCRSKCGEVAAAVARRGLAVTVRAEVEMAASRDELRRAEADMRQLEVRRGQAWGAFGRSEAATAKAVNGVGTRARVLRSARGTLKGLAKRVREVDAALLTEADPERRANMRWWLDTEKALAAKGDQRSLEVARTLPAPTERWNGTRLPERTSALEKVLVQLLDTRSMLESLNGSKRAAALEMASSRSAVGALHGNLTHDRAALVTYERKAAALRLLNTSVNQRAAELRNRGLQLRKDSDQILKMLMVDENMSPSEVERELGLTREALRRVVKRVSKGSWRKRGWANMLVDNLSQLKLIRQQTKSNEKLQQKFAHEVTVASSILRNVSSEIAPLKAAIGSEARALEVEKIRLNRSAAELDLIQAKLNTTAGLEARISAQFQREWQGVLDEAEGAANGLVGLKAEKAKLVHQARDVLSQEEAAQGDRAKLAVQAGNLRRQTSGLLRQALGAQRELLAARERAASAEAEITESSRRAQAELSELRGEAGRLGEDAALTVGRASGFTDGLLEASKLAAAKLEAALAQPDASQAALAQPDASRPADTELEAVEALLRPQNNPPSQ